jgi:hypothetical protein
MKKAVVMLTMLFLLAVGAGPAGAQTTPGGEMKKSGSEVKKAGKSLGRNVKRGRVVRGGKEFGKHVGRSGKHVGKGIKKAVTP